MKHTLRKLTSLAAVMFLSTGFMIPVHADEEMVITFTGEEKGFETTGGSVYTTTDLFNSFKGVMPGDHIEETITFANQDTKNDFVALYLRAEVHDEENNPILDDEDQVTMEDFLSQLHMTVYDGEKVIYDSKMDETDGLTDNVLLGRVSSKETKELLAVVDVPIELGNEYMNREGAVDWIFTVEIPDVPVTPEVPDTGDHMNVFGYGIVGLLAVGVAAGVIIARRRNAE